MVVVLGWMSGLGEWWMSLFVLGRVCVLISVCFCCSRQDTSCQVESMLWKCFPSLKVSWCGDINPARLCDT